MDMVPSIAVWYSGPCLAKTAGYIRFFKISIAGSLHLDFNNIFLIACYGVQIRRTSKVDVRFKICEPKRINPVNWVWYVEIIIRTP